MVGFETWFSGECSVMLGGVECLMLLSRAGGEVMLEILLSHMLARTIRGTECESERRAVGQ